MAAMLWIQKHGDKYVVIYFTAANKKEIPFHTRKEAIRFAESKCSKRGLIIDGSSEKSQAFLKAMGVKQGKQA